MRNIFKICMALYALLRLCTVVYYIFARSGRLPVSVLIIAALAGLICAAGAFRRKISAGRLRALLFLNALAAAANMVIVYNHPINGAVVGDLIIIGTVFAPLVSAASVFIRLPESELELPQTNPFRPFFDAAKLKIKALSKEKAGRHNNR